MRHRKKIFYTDSFINVTINSWKYMLDGEGMEIKPIEIYYRVGEQHESFVKQCCQRFKSQFNQELMYEFRNDICWLKPKI